jgi:hypothetical protein
MDKRQRTWTWLAAVMSFVVGLILVLNDSGAGWFLIIILIHRHVKVLRAILVRSGKVISNEAVGQ